MPWKQYESISNIICIVRRYYTMNVLFMQSDCRGKNTIIRKGSTHENSSLSTHKTFDFSDRNSFRYNFNITCCHKAITC